MKRNIDDFNGMSDFIISIVTVVAWVLIGTIIAIGYFTIETKGESVMLSFVSAIFTIISSLGIAATIIVYFKQKNDSNTLRNEDLSKKKDAIKIITRKNVIDITHQVRLIAAHVQRAMHDDGLKIANNINPVGIEKCLFDSSEINHDMFYVISDLLDAIYDHKNILIDEIEHIKKRHYKRMSKTNKMTNTEKSLFSSLDRSYIDTFCNAATGELDDILNRLIDETL